MNEANTVPSPAKILVVDDNPIIQRSVHFALRDKGYQILMAGEVAEAIKILRREKVDLALVDLSFPLDTASIGSLQQDGFFFIEWLDRTPEVVKPPIIIISSMEPAKYLDRAAAAGVKACLQKPLVKETLLAAVESALSGSGMADQPNLS